MLYYMFSMCDLQWHHLRLAVLHWAYLHLDHSCRLVNQTIGLYMNLCLWSRMLLRRAFLLDLWHSCISSWTSVLMPLMLDPAGFSCNGDATIRVTASHQANLLQILASSPTFRRLQEVQLLELIGQSN
ncbi:hypothetical protein DUNSADRAFT_15075 [Dunaliella salina]|uniref:Encoded protein n=1 Tax=Dunaliella salina TaxID=3046 RepID=A0ABQ7G620_DUNSA|nr:hypothetical protein DUNSADRAFT_15075 [Dunaliella salina]|eukprot:KAF5830056.1 hypothetical protein DUNSADRAFT_15075 [Dunaliella salina]